MMQKPWYRQFWPWLVILLPMSSVVAGLITVYIAVDSADTVIIRDNETTIGKAVIARPNDQ